MRPDGQGVPVPADEGAEDDVEVTGGEDADGVGDGGCVVVTDGVGDGACVVVTDGDGDGGCVVDGDGDGGCVVVTDGDGDGGCVVVTDGDGDGGRDADGVAEPDGDETDRDADGDGAADCDCVGGGSRVSDGDCVSKGVSSVVAGGVPKATGTFERADGMDLDDETDVGAGAVAAAADWPGGPLCVEVWST